jgi:hypothetical protein
LTGLVAVVNMGPIELLLLLGTVAASIYLIVESRSGVEAVSVNRDPAEIISLAVAQVPGGTASLRSSWMPAGHTDRSASFVYKRRPSILLAFVLLCCFIVPGILYIVFGGKSQSLQVDVLGGSADGLTTVQVAASGGTARRRGRRFLRQVQGRPLTASPPAAALPAESE